MSNVVFKAKRREATGTANANRLRRAGRIPAVLYGRKTASVSLDIDEREFFTGIKGISESTIVKVEVDGQTYDAFIKSTQRNIMTGSVVHVDFYAVESGQLLRTRVSVRVQGNPVGVRDGGILELPLHEIEVECYPKDLPERIEVDIANLQVNQSIHVRDLSLGENVKLISAPDQVVALVKFAKAEAAPAAAAEAETAAAEGGAAAADAKAPAADGKAPAGKSGDEKKA